MSPHLASLGRAFPLPDVHAPPGHCEHESFAFQHFDGVRDHVFADVVGLPERPVGRQRATGPLASGYPLAEYARKLEVCRYRAAVVDGHTGTVRQGKTDLTCGYPYSVLLCPVLACLGIAA
jgi:hypothetical protein